MKYTQKEFKLDANKVLSKEQIDLHLALYAGYISKTNALYEQIEKLEKEKAETNILIELKRRLSFELAGIYNHELYFLMLEGGPNPIPEGNLKNAIVNSFGSFDNFTNKLKQLSEGARGIGWTIVNYDKERKLLNMLWVEDHELGNISLPAVLAIDMWEHAYLVDYKPKDKGVYAENYISQINWQKCSDRFDTLID